MRRRARGGFSMIELLLVVSIILLTTLVAVPNFVKSFRGARLRTSARTVVMTHRHARSTAVLHQKHLAVLFDTVKNELEVVALADNRDAAATDRFLDARAGMAGSEEPAEDGQVSVETDLVRSLEQNIRIGEFEMTKEEQEHDGIYWVNYYPNGMCDGYALTLVDEKEKELRIEVDPYSGKMQVGEE